METLARQPQITRLGFATDKGVGARARIGLLVLESDQTIEAEFRALANMPDVSIYHARLAMQPMVTPETLATMAEQLPIAAQLIPQSMAISAIGYGCTSGATIIGEERISAILDAAHPGIPSSNPLTAAKAALKALGIQRLALITPYSPDVTEAMQRKFTQAGIEVTLVGSFYESNDEIVGRITEPSIYEAALAIGQSPACDGVFISCTNLRAAGIIEKAEHNLQKPVIASNHALAWHLLRLAGIDDRLEGFGKLYRL